VLRDGAKRVRISGHDVVVKAQVASLDGYSNHADRSGLIEWIKDRTPVRGSLFLVHGEQSALSSLAETMKDVPDFPATIIPALGETWELQPGRPATRLTVGRADAADLTASRDWISKLAALREEVEEKISRQPTNQDREKMLAALRRALESVN
jgi:metallo-beta-lactamase family protein